MKTNNELIAEFMGLPLTKEVPEFTEGRKIKTVPFQNWKYHSSWDWLMPVVEKIAKLESENIDMFNKPIGDANKEASMQYFNVTGLFITTSIDKVYKTVIEFIKWYNQLKEV